MDVPTSANRSWAQNTWAPGNRTHGFDHAERGHDDTERGQSSAMVSRRSRSSASWWCLSRAFPSPIRLVWILQAHGHHPQRVADEREGEVIFGNSGIAFEDRGFLGLLDMGFEGDQAFGFHGLGEKK